MRPDQTAQRISGRIIDVKGILFFNREEGQKDLSKPHKSK